MTIAAQGRGLPDRVRDTIGGGTGGQRQERLSVTVAPDLAEYVRAAAERVNGGQSAVVADALRLHRREVRRLQTMRAIELNRELDAEMAEEGVRTGASIG